MAVCGPPYGPVGVSVVIGNGEAGRQRIRRTGEEYGIRSVFLAC